MELTEEQINYIKTIRFWQKSQDNLCSQLNINIDNSEKMIFNHTECLNNSKAQLEHEIEFTKNGMKTFFIWCDENGIDPYVKL